MSPNDVQLIDVGRPEWPRWMIFHDALSLYWGQSEWQPIRRDGELWLSEADAFEEFRKARMDCQELGSDE
jgi:hypothetical protein